MLLEINQLASLLILLYYFSVEFVVGDKPVSKFRMIERHFYKEKLLKSFDFEFGFCIPHSRNTVEHIYEFPSLNTDESKCNGLRRICILWIRKMHTFFYIMCVLKWNIFHQAVQLVLRLFKRLQSRTKSVIFIPVVYILSKWLVS